MTAISPINSEPAPRSDGPHLFGAPIGDFGLGASLLISGALGFIAFFATTFVSIFGLMIYNGATGHHITLDTSYKLIALPAGVVVLVGSFLVMMALWLRRKLTH